MRRGSVAVLLVVACTGLGCFQARHRLWFGDQASPATRAELYERFGPPEAIARDGDERIFRYDSARTKGQTLGASYWGIRVVISRKHRVSDRIWVRVAADDRVVSVQRAPYTEDFGYRLWPFGD